VPYDALDDAIAYVNARPRPLALYYFDDDARRVARVLDRTVSGGVTVNDVVLHLGQHALPFGGVGASGMGQYHGFDGFVTFSKAMPVLRQARWTLSDRLKPPYSGFPAKMIRLLLR
jgi:coniferyl-aldehyde dehydrogenase